MPSLIAHVVVRRERAVARREEWLEDRALNTKMQYDLKIAKVKQRARVRRCEWEDQIQLTEDKHRRLDQQIEQKKEFLAEQGIIAQKFLTQKLKLKSEQQKQWLKQQSSPIQIPGAHSPKKIIADPDRCDALAEPIRRREKVVVPDFHERGDNPTQGTWRFQGGPQGARMNFYT